MPKLNQLNHFEKFALKPAFDLDIDDLENRYLQLQKKFHPDNLVNQNKEHQELAALESIAANEGYEIIKNPLRRAIYLLQLEGINIEDDNCEVKPDQETLLLILDLKEKLFGSEDKLEAAQIKEFASKQIKEILEEVKEDFANQNYKKAAQKLIKVKYLDKILLDIKLKGISL